jgi:hypothetical protein
MAEHYFPKVEHGRAPVPVVVALVVLVSGMVAAFVIGSPSGTARGASAAQSFLAAWERSRLATYVVRSDFVRTLPDGRQLKSNTTTVQQPPDTRLVSGLGSVSGRLNGKVVGCAGSPDSSAGCVVGAPAPDYRGEVDAQLRQLESYVTGPRPLYQVVDFGFGDTPTHCFRLDLAIALPSPPYGDHALFCFDRRTGAPALTEIERPEATDRTIAREVRTDVRPEDLQLPADRGAVVGVPGPATPGG